MSKPPFKRTGKPFKKNYPYRKPYTKPYVSPYKTGEVQENKKKMEQIELELGLIKAEILAIYQDMDETFKTLERNKTIDLTGSSEESEEDDLEAYLSAEEDEIEGCCPQVKQDSSKTRTLKRQDATFNGNIDKK